MQRACPECGQVRILGVGHPTVARCVCGCVWCWLCRRPLGVTEACGRLRDYPEVSARLGDVERVARSGCALAVEAALASVHALVPTGWRTHPMQLAAYAAGESGGTTVGCPAYLELVELAGVFPAAFDAAGPGSPANREAWHRVVAGDLVLRR